MTPKLFALATLIVLSSLIMNTLAFSQEVLDKAQYRFHYESPSSHPHDFLERDYW